MRITVRRLQTDRGQKWGRAKITFFPLFLLLTFVWAQDLRPFTGLGLIHGQFYLKATAKR